MNAWYTSGTAFERRPPKMNAAIGTPVGSSAAESITGHWLIGAVKRALKLSTDPAAEVTPISTAAPLHVLVVDDNDVNLRVAAKMLDRLGCTAETVLSGRLALAALAEGRFDLVLMDCQMPELDGNEATREIRAMGGRLATLPVIALTANVLASDREACLRAGMDDVLTKPVKLDVLRATVQRWAPPAPAQRS